MSYQNANAADEAEEEGVSLISPSQSQAQSQKEENNRTVLWKQLVKVSCIGSIILVLGVFSIQSQSQKNGSVVPANNNNNNNNNNDGTGSSTTSTSSRDTLPSPPPPPPPGTATMTAWTSSTPTKISSSSSSSTTKEQIAVVVPMPSGVNLGSWLSLEDYFYVGKDNAIEVATPDDKQVGICLPPLHVGQIGSPSWNSETDLLHSLLQVMTIQKAIKVFHAHRLSYITESDLQHLSQPPFEIQHVRIPLSWCFTDFNPDDIDITDMDNITPEYQNDLQTKFTCTDPFYSIKNTTTTTNTDDDTVLWPAIPKSLMLQFLRNCASHGITASLDIHTYPGATSPGTFSGVWPRPPLFWKFDTPSEDNNNNDNDDSSNLDVGRQVLFDFIQWIESLEETDPQALAGVRAISPMNEPAHLAGVFKYNPEKDYLPPLPAPLAKSYLKELNSDNDNDEDGFIMPDGPHLRVLLWLRDAVITFRNSKLPSLGKQFHVNVHESFIDPNLFPTNDDNDNDDDDQRVQPDAYDLIAYWWSKTTTEEERKTWAVLDMHHYHAWDPKCMGAVDGPPFGNYSCNGNIPVRNEALHRCAKWAYNVYRPTINKYCEESALLMSGEFSTSTHHRIRHACNDIDTLKESYLQQLHAAKQADVELYYWSYKMPFGGAFQSAWSFSQLMYLLGVSNRPDVSTYDCGVGSSNGGISIVPENLQMTDDWF